MSSGRAILSRPRTRVYDANYNIGESYYKGALDRLDRKYSGRPLSPPRQSALPSLAQDLLNRHDRTFANEDLATSRRRAEKHITERHLFDSRGGRIVQRGLDLVDNDIDEETASALSRIRANKKVSVIDDVDLENAVTSINSRRLLDRSEKALRSVGINEDSRRALDEDISIKSRRSLKVSYEDDGGNLTKWSPIKRQERQERQERQDRQDDSFAEGAAIRRAKQTRERIVEIDDEMAALAEKQVARERRAARLKALVAESAEETEAAQSAMKAISIRSRRAMAELED